MNKPLELVFMFFVSIPIWYIFELFNLLLLNWSYTPEFTQLIRFVSAMLLLPAAYETYLLINSIGFLTSLN